MKEAVRQLVEATARINSDNNAQESVSDNLAEAGE